MKARRLHSPNDVITVQPLEICDTHQAFGIDAPAQKVGQRRLAAVLVAADFNDGTQGQTPAQCSV